MPIDRELVEELSLLRRFSRGGAVAMDVPASSDPAVIAAAARMFEKKLITSAQGGKLTESGQQATAHLERLFYLLDPPLEPI